MADKIVDMHFPDNYHRAKRALLIYCAALVVIWFAHGPVEFGPAGPRVSIPVDALRIMLWLAAAYYAAIYYNEVRIVRRLNSEIMLNPAVANLDNAFMSIATQIESVQTEIVTKFKELNRKFGQIVASLDRLVNDGELHKTEYDFGAGVSHIIRTEGQKIGDHSLEWEAALSQRIEAHIQARIAAAINFTNSQFLNKYPFIEASERLLQDQHALGVEALNSLSGSDKLIGSTRKSFEKLAAAISRERMINFYGLEIGVSAVMFIIATGAAMPTIVPLGNAAWNAIKNWM